MTSWCTDVHKKNVFMDRVRPYRPVAYISMSASADIILFQKGDENLFLSPFLEMNRKTNEAVAFGVLQAGASDDNWRIKTNKEIKQ